MKSIFSLGAISVAVSSLVPTTTATAPANGARPPADAARGAAPSAAVGNYSTGGGVYESKDVEHALNALQWDRDHDVSVEDIINARQHTPQAFDTLCRCACRRILVVLFVAHL